MRNPVGPLPSSIYWRRRAVAASLIALFALLIAWAVTSGGGEGNKGDAKAGGPDPAPSITPGPSGSGPAISQQPGGRDESGSGGDAGSDGSNGDTGPGAGGSDGGGGASADASASAAGGASDGTSGGASGAEQVPAGSPLPDCTSGSLRLSLKTAVSYGPDDKPVFQLIAKNTSASACKADLGPKNTVLTITEAGGEDDRIWSSEDCPAASGHLYLKVPAGATVVHTVEWDRRKSSPGCASSAPTKEAGPGTYLLEAKSPGEPLQRASFVLPKD